MVHAKIENVLEEALAAIWAQTGACVMENTTRICGTRPGTGDAIHSIIEPDQNSLESDQTPPFATSDQSLH